MIDKKPVGRPPVFSTAEELTEATNEYFEKGGKITITGLALHLGFCSRQSFYDYEKHEEFSYIIKMARLRVENYYEEMLTDTQVKPTGSIFALKNMGWKDNSKVEVGGDRENPVQHVHSITRKIVDAHRD